MDVKQEPFDLYEGVIKTESNSVPVSAQTEENGWCSTKQQIFKNQDDTDNVSKYQDPEQSMNVCETKQEIFECTVPKIEYQPLDVPSKIDYDSVCEKVRFCSTTIKNELHVICDTNQEVAKTESDLLSTYCDLPTLKSEDTDYPDYLVHPCSSKNAGKTLTTFKTIANFVYKKRRPNPCPLCYKNFPSKSRSKHIVGHFGNGFVVCEFCGKLMTKINFFRHYFIHVVNKRSRKGSLKLENVRANKKPFNCGICYKEFNHKSSLQQHLIIHTGGKPFKCDVCSESFTRKFYLRKHLSIHAGEKPFNCDICSKAFKYKSNLQKHLINHTNERQFKCDICSNEFKNKSNLQRHVIKHTNEKPFKCDVCSKDFKWKSSLQQHLTIHTEKRFKCDICSKQFNLNSSLQRHLVIHANEKPFKCDICSKTFNRKSSLKYHLMKKPFKCDMCFKAFRRNADLQRHLIIHGY